MRYCTVFSDSISLGIRSFCALLGSSCAILMYLSSRCSWIEPSTPLLFIELSSILTKVIYQHCPASSPQFNRGTCAPVFVCLLGAVVIAYFQRHCAFLVALDNRKWKEQFSQPIRRTQSMIVCTTHFLLGTPRNFGSPGDTPLPNRSTMRYDNWDVIIFARDSHIPIQEFKTACYSSQDECKHRFTLHS
jgi:hypothetical protein